MYCRPGRTSKAVSALTEKRQMQTETFGDAEEIWPSFDDRAVVSPCEACGTGADSRQGVDYLKGCPDCGALVKTRLQLNP